MDTNFAQRRRRDLIVAACLAAIAALVPLFVKDVYVQNIMVLTLMYAALSQSWNILSGYCGQISLGHALYFGLGAYTTALLFTTFGVLSWFIVADLYTNTRLSRIDTFQENVASLILAVLLDPVRPNAT